MRWTTAAMALLACTAAAARSAEAQADSVTTCVLRGAELVPFRMAARDTAAFQDSVRRADGVPRAGYAAGEEWYEKNRLPYMRGWWLRKEGEPRFLEPVLLQRVGDFAGVGVYAEAGARGPVETIYFPTRAGCEFQRYRSPDGPIPLERLARALLVPPAAGTREVRTCLAVDGELREVVFVFDPTWPDTTYSHGERPFSSPVPRPDPDYAGGQRWFVNNEPFRFNDRGFVKYGLPLVVELGKLKQVGRYQGVLLYAEMQEGDDPLVLYVPIRPGCEFQRYQTEPIGRGVRG